MTFISPHMASEPGTKNDADLAQVLTYGSRIGLHYAQHKACTGLGN